MLSNDTRRRLLYVGFFLIVNALVYFTTMTITGHVFSFYIDGIDNAIPFIPEFVWVYLSLFPVMLSTLFLKLKNFVDFRKTLISYFFFIVISSVIYVLAPSIYPVSLLHYNNSISSFVVAWIHSFDNGNTLPSGHAAFSLLTTIAPWKTSGLAWRFAYLFWFCMIILSTLFLKQHHVLDVLAGAVIAFVCRTLANRF